MILFARMDGGDAGALRRWRMIVAGLGMGLLQPVYTLAVQNVAPREQMGAATSSTIFFRSIGSTVGVAAFGSVMLTRYHEEFDSADSGRRAGGGAGRTSRTRCCWCRSARSSKRGFGAVAGGRRCCRRCSPACEAALLHGLEQIFFWSAVIMTASILLHMILKREPLRVPRRSTRRGPLPRPRTRSRFRPRGTAGGDSTAPVTLTSRP